MLEGRRYKRPNYGPHLQITTSPSISVCFSKNFLYLSYLQVVRGCKCFTSLVWLFLVLGKQGKVQERSSDCKYKIKMWGFQFNSLLVPGLKNSKKEQMLRDK